MFKIRRLRNLNILKMWKVPLQMCTYHKKPLKLPSMWVVTAVRTNQSNFESEDIILKFEKLNFKFDFYFYLKIFPFLLAKLRRGKIFLNLQFQQWPLRNPFLQWGWYLQERSAHHLTIWKSVHMNLLKFLHSEKATKIWRIFQILFEIT